MKYGGRIETGIGTITIQCEEDALSCIRFGKIEIPECIWKKTSLIEKTADQIHEYFAGTRKTFDLPLSPQGTEFQKKVWNALLTIPYGETRSYKDIAVQIQNPKGCRAVGMANNRNPIPIIIPCHRVIGANGNLIGYVAGLDIKTKLLNLEQGKCREIY